MSKRPNPMPRFYRWRTNVIQLPAFCLATAVCASLALAVSLVDRTGRTQHRIARAWARLCVWIAASRLTVRGAENLTRCSVAVYASNHTSYMDIPVVFAALPFQFRILAKEELWRWPFIGWYLARSGQVPIVQENRQAAHSSLGAAVKALRSGMPLFIFPEGSRTPDGELQEFQAGAAYLAIRAQAPIVPIALSGVYDLLPIHTRHFFPGELTLSACEPIETKGMTVRQTAELTARVRAAIAERLNANGMKEGKLAETAR
jgi:1-acyl-sn-glycerol-3-phosphate acyltransferase